MITPEQVADLQPGDVVEIRWDAHPGVIVSGPLRPRGGGQWVGPVPVIGPSGEMHESITLTVISRAPRPIYVNHPRTEPADGDIVLDCDGDAWRFERDGWWCAYSEACPDDEGFPIESYRPLTLLRDGETGQVVP